MDRSYIIFIVTLTIVLCLAYSIAGKTVQGVGVHDFGSNITENQSCQFAKDKAVADAIRNAFGETVGATDWQMCDGNSCTHNFFSWIEQQGQVKRILNETKVVLDNPRRCRVSVFAEVEKFKQKDPNFHINYKLNRAQYKNGDHVIISLDPSREMYVTVFAWAQVNGFVKLHQSKRVSNKFQVPNPDSGFNLVVKHNYTQDTEELILIVASKTKLHFSEQYNTQDLLRILQQHKAKGVLVHKISYQVVL